MIKTLVIHLGDTKTGSTAIQSVLRSGEYVTPRGQTVCYPGQSLNHNRLPKALSKVKNAERQLRLFDPIVQELRESNADFGVISAELFQAVDPQNLKRIIDSEMADLSDRMRLISYVRPHAERLVSTYSEQSKFGRVSGDIRSHFQTMGGTKRLQYAPRFAAWRQTFGDKFHLRFFQRDHLLKGDVVADFFAWMLQEDGTKIHGAQQSNAALTVGQIALLRRYHNLMGKTPQTGRADKMPASIARALVAQFRVTGLGANMDRVTIPEKLAARLKQSYSSDARALDAAFFDGTPMLDALNDIPAKLIGTNANFDADSYFSQDVLQAFDTMAQMSILLMGDDVKELRARAKDARVKTKQIQ
jgi:hypothetical protein